MIKPVAKGFDRALLKSTTLQALALDDIDCFLNLLDRGFLTVDVDLEGTRPIHEVARLGYADFLSVLLEKGADVHVRDCLNETAADHAMRFGQVDCIRLLFSAGVDIQPSFRLYPCLPLEKQVKVCAFLKREVFPLLFWLQRRTLCYAYSHQKLKVPRNLLRAVSQFLA